MTVGLVLTALAFGFRHGIDWDHIAAIADLSGSAENRRRGFVLSLVYALGHAVAVFALGCGAILLGTSIPAGVDEWMGRIVGVTLVLLGGSVFVGLARHGHDFRLRSRWMLIIGGTFAGLRRVRRRRAARSIAVEHEHEHEHVDGNENEPHSTSFAHDHAHRSAQAAVTPAAIRPTVPVGGRTAPASLSVRHRHAHRHELALPSSATARYGSGTATGIGLLHGIGVESPTQIAVFVASTSVVGGWGGVGLLIAWIVGLVVANTLLAVLVGFGVLHAERNFAVYATVAVVAAVMSVAVGLAFVAGIDALPPIDL